MSVPAQGPITLYAPKPVSVKMFPPSGRRFNFISKLKTLLSVLIVSGIVIGFYPFAGYVWGVLTQGGSALTLDLVLDEDFNLSLAGYLEGTQLKSTATSGAPLILESDGLVANLNADLLDGQHGIYYLDWGNFANTPDVLSSLDGVLNNTGNIDLLAGANVTITPNDLANTITISTAAGAGSGWIDDGTEVRLETATDSVGIGTDAPWAKLSVISDGDAISGESVGGMGVYGFSEGDTGVYGESTDSVGVYGYSTNDVGVYGNTNSGWAGYFSGPLYASGDVGINDLTPDGKLSVKATGIVTASTYVLNLRNLVTNDTDDGINKYGAYITSTGDFTGEAGTPTNNWGLYVDTVSGADNNYGAYFADKVGIGTTSPEGTLHVFSGSAGAVTASDVINSLVVESGATPNGISILSPNPGTSYIMFGNPSDNQAGGIEFSHGSGVLGFLIANATRLSLASDTVVVNENSNDVDFRVEGNGDANLIFADAGTDRVGIGTVTPGTKLTVSGDPTATFKAGYLSADNLLLAQLEAGLYLGGVGLRENQWDLASVGVTWSARDSNRNWLGVAMSSDGKYQTATTNTGQIYTSSDYGATWTARDSSRDWDGVAMSSDGKHQTAVVFNGQIYTSSDYGVTWTARDSSRGWRDVAMSSDGKYQTAGVATGGQLYTSSDYGVTWTARDSSRSWYGVAMSSDGKVQTAVAYVGRIYTSSDYGVTWTARDSVRGWYRVAMSSDGKYQTAGVNTGQLYTSSDYGVTWTARDSSRAWLGVAMSSNGKYQTAVVASGQIYTSSDYGVTWTARDSSRNWNRVAVSSDGKVQTAVTNGTQIYVSFADSYSPGGNIGVGTATVTSGYKLQVVGGALCVDDDTSNCPSSPTSGAIYVEASVGTGNVSAFDIAEFYNSSESVEKGDLLVINPNSDGQVRKSTEAYQSSVIGVASTNPAIVMDEDNITFGKNLGDNFNPIKPYVALAGRVPVKISAENGSITPGDSLTSSSIPGVAMKATAKGPTVGKALEPFSGSGVGKISMFVNVSWYDPGVLVDSGGDAAQVNPDDSVTKIASPTIEAEEGIFEKITATIVGTFEKLIAKTAQIASAVIDTLKVGELQLDTTKPQPACDAESRGKIWFVKGDPGVADTLEVCAKNASDEYGWRTIY